MNIHEACVIVIKILAGRDYRMEQGVYNIKLFAARFCQHLSQYQTI